MKKIVVMSANKSAGKTCLIAGLAKALGKEFGYLKPFGDRLIYRKKRLWDYDSALMTEIFGLKTNPENLSLGFEHARLSFMYDEDDTRKKLNRMVAEAGQDKEILFIEGGSGLTFGASVYLDAISLARFTGSSLLFVVGGDDYEILDNLIFIKKYLETKDIVFDSVIINKVKDVENFKSTFLPGIKETGFKVLGIVPYKSELTYVTVNFLVEHMFAKVIAGEGGLGRVVKNVFVGAMSAAAAQRILRKENMLIITGGDRSDMILAAIETNTSCVILTNNIVPPSNVLSRASEANVPLLLVPGDTNRTVRQIDHLEPLLSKDDKEKIDLLEFLVKDFIILDEIV